MKKEAYKRVQAAVAAGTGIGMAVAVLQNSIYLALGVVLAGMGIMYLSSRKVTEETKDEMVYRMAEKASRRAFQVFVPVAAFAGLFIVVTNWFTELNQVGQTLVYSALGLMLLYSLFYSYYGRSGLK